MKRNIYLLVFYLLFQNLEAQDFEKELKEAINKKPKLEFRFDSRNSFISTSGVQIVGLKVGVQYDKKLSIGLGYNQLWSTINNNNIVYKNETFRGELKFNYFSPYIDYTFYRDEHWELSIPIQLGFGQIYYKNHEAVGPKKLKESFVSSYEPAIAFEYRFLKYFGVGLGVGYRLMIIPNQEIKERFTSPVYIFKSKIYFQDLYYKLMNK